MKKDTSYGSLIGRYLSGNYTDEEKLFVENWLNESADNRAEFDEYAKLWSYSASNDAEFIVDVDEGWNELNRKIEEIERLSIDFTHTRPTVSRRFIYIASRVAAVLVITFGIVFLINRNASQEPQKITLAATEIMNAPFVLSDGSEVLLNKAAEIKYPETFSGENRAVDFCGEAYFNITHNPGKPFIIDAGEVQIEVLGTAFNLVASPDCEKIVLYLESGKVRFSSVNLVDGSIREQLVLLPGQKAVYNKTNGIITRSQFETKNYLAWRTGILEFNKTPLNEVISAIEQTYHLQVVSKKSFDDLSLTARFDNESPESIFKSIQTIFGIDYQIDGETVSLN